MGTIVDFQQVGSQWSGGVIGLMDCPCLPPPAQRKARAAWTTEQDKRKVEYRSQHVTLTSGTHWQSTSCCTRSIGGGALV